MKKILHAVLFCSTILCSVTVSADSCNPTKEWCIHLRGDSSLQDQVFVIGEVNLTVKDGNDSYTLESWPVSRVDNALQVVIEDDLTMPGIQSISYKLMSVDDQFLPSNPCKIQASGSGIKGGNYIFYLSKVAGKYQCRRG